MTGTILNVAGIVVGAIVGLTWRKRLSAERESFFQVMLGVFTVFYGLRLTWISINGSLWQVSKQLLIVILALMLGKITGRLLHFQKLSNALGRDARERITASKPGQARVADALSACSILFCAAPLAMLGAVQDGLSGYFYPLAIKACIDGLATMGFVALFGWGVLLSVLPVLAFQGSLTLLCELFLKPFLVSKDLIDPANAAGGLLVFSVALVILGIKKIELADYLPSLMWAPLLAYFFR